MGRGERGHGRYVGEGGWWRKVSPVLVESRVADVDVAVDDLVRDRRVRRVDDAAVGRVEIVEVGPTVHVIVAV